MYYLYSYCFRSRIRSLLWVSLLGMISVIAALIADSIQNDFGQIEVGNVEFANEHGLLLRGKLFRPKEASSTVLHSGVVFIHGYQSSREAGDVISIEAARRGFTVLSIDAAGRGNSGIPPLDINHRSFDPTFGGKAALKYLKTLSHINHEAVGMVGHSLGAQAAYEVALHDPTVRALVLIGSAYDERSSSTLPQNMLMIFGTLDEFRDRMTQTKDFKAEWMKSKKTFAAFGFDSAEINTTYGDFSQGTARRVFAPRTFHETEIHDLAAVAETTEWLRQALTPNIAIQLSPSDQIGVYKEFATLAAMLAGLGMLFPFSTLLLGFSFFSDLRLNREFSYHCSKYDFAKNFGINTLMMWLYLPCSMIVFAIHKYVVRIDGLFPMMVVNVVALWLCLSNFIGVTLFFRKLKKTDNAAAHLYDLGISWSKQKMLIDRKQTAKTALFAACLFVFTYGFELFLEHTFLVDYRFVFSFASDLTPYRWKMFFLYLPFFVAAFTAMGFFLHGVVRCAPSKSFISTFLRWSLINFALLSVPMFLLAAFQYLPLLLTGSIPLVGPGGMFVLFVINIGHLIIVSVIIAPLSTKLYMLTGRPYAGALVTALIVTWMFVSSQVIAPVPI